jgi:hypothetical protein
MGGWVTEAEVCGEPRVQAAERSAAFPSAIERLTLVLAKLFGPIEVTN